MVGRVAGGDCDRSENRSAPRRHRSAHRSLRLGLVSGILVAKTPNLTGICTLLGQRTPARDASIACALRIRTIDVNPFWTKSTRNTTGGKMKTRLAKVTQFAILSLLLIGIGIASSSSAAAQRRKRC